MNERAISYVLLFTTKSLNKSLTVWFYEYILREFLILSMGVTCPENVSFLNFIVLISLILDNEVMLLDSKYITPDVKSFIHYLLFWFNAPSQTLAFPVSIHSEESQKNKCVQELDPDCPLSPFPLYTVTIVVSSDC
jgi:hypothetical protein